MNTNTACLFCKIASKEIPADIVYEGEDIIAFKDVNPIAPVHILVIPEKHIETVNDFRPEDEKLAGKMIIIAQGLAKEFGIAKNGYKLLFRIGEDGGQEIQHVHLHLIGGAKLYEEIRPE